MGIDLLLFGVGYVRASNGKQPIPELYRMHGETISCSMKSAASHKLQSLHVSLMLKLSTDHVHDCKILRHQQS